MTTADDKERKELLDRMAAALSAGYVAAYADVPMADLRRVASSVGAELARYREFEATLGDGRAHRREV